LIRKVLPGSFRVYLSFFFIMKTTEALRFLNLPMSSYRSGSFSTSPGLRSSSPIPPPLYFPCLAPVPFRIGVRPASAPFPPSNTFEWQPRLSDFLLPYIFTIPRALLVSLACKYFFRPLFLPQICYKSVLPASVLCPSSFIRRLDSQSPPWLTSRSFQALLP